MVLLILAVIWAAVLIPPALKNRAESSPVDSIGNFRRQLNTLQRTGPSAGPSPAHRIAPYSSTGVATVAVRSQSLTLSEARARRRMILSALAAAVPVTFLMAVFSGGIVWMVQLMVDLALGAYVAMLVKVRNEAAEREMKVRFLPGPAVAPAPELALRRSGT